MTGDITLPDDWVPIGATKTGQKYSGQGANVWPFSGIFDGGDHLLTVPEGGLPLLGYVRGAQVKNLNIYGSKIAGYGLVNNYGVDYGATGDYSDYTKNASYPYMPLTIEVDNVTLKSGTQTLKSGFIGGYASGANTINLFGCTVEKNVVIGYDKDQTGIGSFAGDLNGTLMNCVSYADVYGVGAVGGLVGMKGQSMSHDHHNIVTVGADDADMALAVNTVAQMQGGLCVAAGGEVLAKMCLPIGGLMSECTADEVMAELDVMNGQARTLGCTGSAPFMTLSFISLPTVPELGLTDLGLVDVLEHRLIPVERSGSDA